MIRALFLLLILLCTPAMAQAPAKQPIEVTAEKTLEWDREAKVFTARQNAIAKQGSTELHGDLLTAKYTEGVAGAGGMTISRIDAEGNVKVISDGSTATGQRGFYDVKGNYTELTGNNLKVVTGTDTVTARDKITYHANTREMNAYGNARATQGDDVITADRLIGRMKPGAKGDSDLDEMEAIGNVVITTPTETMYGSRALYKMSTNIATMTGNVRIERGPNVIEGARGEINLDTNVSKIFGGAPTASSDADPFLGGSAPAGDGRVRGVFYPE